VAAQLMAIFLFRMALLLKKIIKSDLVR